MSSWTKYIKSRIARNKNFLAIFTGSTGCLSGDASINTSRNEVGRKYPIGYLYTMFHGKVAKGRRRWKLENPTFVRSFDGGIIKLNRLKDVIYSGKKEVYQLTLENGLTIKATSDHKFLTQKEGWQELNNLLGKKIMCDQLNPEALKRKRIRLRDIGLCVGKNYLYNIQPNGQIPVHILIYESRLNNIEFTKYLDILLNEPETCKNLKFINPNTHLIHHKDGCHYNNSIENLELIIKGEHHFKHNLYTNFSQGVPKFSEVVKIDPQGIEDTYDLECEDPDHNFVANGIIVHNSGKSWSAISIAKQLDPEFNETRIVFKAKDLLALVNSGNLKKGSVIIWDETQIDLSNRSWQSLTNKLLNYLITTFRHRCFILFFTSPYSDFLDSATMKLFHANFEMKKINKEEQTATINPILLQYNQSMKKWYRKHLRSVKHGSGTSKIKLWRVPKPSEELIKLYEEQKMLFTSKLNKEIEDKLNNMDSDGKLKKEPAALSERPLTINQSKVLECLKKGMSSPNEIAKVTGILPPNVSSNINSLYQKGYKIVFTANSYSLIRPTPVGSNLNSMPAEKMATINDEKK